MVEEKKGEKMVVERRRGIGGTEKIEARRGEMRRKRKEEMVEWRRGDGGREDERRWQWR